MRYFFHLRGNGDYVPDEVFRGTTQIEALDLAGGARSVLTTREGEKWSPHWVGGQSILYVSGGPEDGVKRAAGAAGARRARRLWQSGVVRGWPNHGLPPGRRQGLAAAPRLDLARSAVQHRPNGDLPASARCH